MAQSEQAQPTSQRTQILAGSNPIAKLGMNHAPLNPTPSTTTSTTTATSTTIPFASTSAAALIAFLESLPDAPPGRQQESDQPSVETLISLGVKVRDFAYESTLPPVTVVRRRQIQPGPVPLKRYRREYDAADSDDPFSQPSTSTAHGGGGDEPYKRLKRTPTEPVMGMGWLRPRERGFADLEAYDGTTPVERYIDDGGSSQQSNNTWSSPSHSQHPPPLSYSQSQSQSQEAEPYIVTPTVTPNGSLQWPADVMSGSVPASQLYGSSQIAPEPISLTDLGFPEFEPGEDSPQQEALEPRSISSTTSSPLSSPPSSLEPSLAFIPASDPPLPPPAIGPPSSPPSRPPSPRYHLRKRPAVSPPASPTPQTTSRARRAPTSPRPVPPFPMRSRSENHKPSAAAGKSSSRVRTLRRGAGEEGMIVR